MTSEMQRQRIQVLLAPTDAQALRFARSPRRIPRPSLSRLLETARANRIEAAITRAESRLMQRRARRIAANAARRVRDLAWRYRGSARIDRPAFDRRSA